ncbi:MAG: hypothetical protein DRI32_07405 [Chloroflexi bacterium]|nr:MAG: hypothetical protein DRI32_07405 [Chloroflexota bacterium]
MFYRKAVNLSSSYYKPNSRFHEFYKDYFFMILHTFFSKWREGQKWQKKVFYDNKKQMLYDKFRKEGYMIGNGPIESACKQIVSHRLRCSGTQWKVEGTSSTAKARIAWLNKNNDWESISSVRAKLPLASRQYLCAHLISKKDTQLSKSSV